MEKTNKREHKGLYIVLSIVIACALWFYVRNVDNPDQTVTINNIPVTFVGEDILNAGNLMVVSETKTTVNLEVQGKWSVISRLRRDNITIQADLRRVSGPGEYSLAYEIIWPTEVSRDNISVLDRDPFYVPVTVSRRVSRPVEVRGTFTGSVAKGYQAGEFVFQPNTIEVGGEETAVAQVAYALVTLNRQDLDETVQEEMSYTLIGQDGQPLEEDDLAVEPATVNVTLPVVSVKEVPLTVDLIPGGGADPENTDNVQVDISPKSIMLSGSETDLAAYSSINLGSIDLAKVIGTAQFPFTIPVGQEVENISGVQEATVEVTISNLETRMFETTNIEVVGVPEGVTPPTVITQSMQVQVRGATEILDAILPQYVKVVVDLTGQSLPAGQNVVTPKVSVSGVSNAGVIGEYKVSIFLEEGI